MGALWTWRPRPSRTGALATTLAVHVAAVAALVLAFHREPHPPSTIAFVSTLILLAQVVLLIRLIFSILANLQILRAAIASQLPGEAPQTVEPSPSGS